MNAKQTAMAAYGFTEWPGTHVRSPNAVNARGYACVLMEAQGLSRPEIAFEIGFHDGRGVYHAINIFKAKKGKVDSMDDKRIAELEAECVRLGQGMGERYWEARWRDADAELKALKGGDA